MTTKPTFDEWKLDQEITVSMSVAVNGELVYDSDWYSLDSMEEDLRKPERAIEEALQQQYNDAFPEPEDED